jgi:hypothetical protein
VELLITILIISILAGLILGVAALAGETAREAQSRHVVARLHNLVMEHYNTYTTRRVRLRPEVISAINALSGLTPAQRGRAMANARLYALRELILMEVPDRWSDILLTAVPSNNANSVTPKYPVYLDVSESSTGRTALASVYLRRYFQAAKNATTAADVQALIENQGAECLYLVVTLATGDGEARSLFGESTIGDTDGDGAPEFLDGWGHPIQFLRWAPGFDSLIQISANALPGTPPDDPGENPEWELAAGGDHDQFDVFRIDPAAFRLVPLIYSAGRDEELGIWQVDSSVTWQGITNVQQSFSAPFPRLSPYQKITGPLDSTTATAYLGSAISVVDPDLENTSTDNVHNHLVGQR